MLNHFADQVAIATLSLGLGLRPERMFVSFNYFVFSFFLSSLCPSLCFRVYFFFFFFEGTCNNTMEMFLLLLCSK